MMGSRTKVKVINFEKLLGMDALWKMAIQTKNEKAKEIIQELLVALHLKFDNTTISGQAKLVIVNQFVTRCMQMLSQSASNTAEGEESKMIQTESEAYSSTPS